MPSLSVQGNPWYKVYCAIGPHRSNHRHNAKVVASAAAYRELSRDNLITRANMDMQSDHICTTHAVTDAVPCPNTGGAAERHCTVPARVCYPIMLENDVRKMSVTCLNAMHCIFIGLALKFCTTRLVLSAPAYMRSQYPLLPAPIAPDCMSHGRGDEYKMM